MYKQVSQDLGWECCSGEAPGQDQKRRGGGCGVPSYPDEQLCEDNVGHGAGQMQSCAPISIPVGLIHLLLGAVGQERHHEAQVILHHGPQQLLPQRDVRLRQRRQEQLLLVLGPDPALLLLPADGTLSPSQVGQPAWAPCTEGQHGRPDRPLC